jgi:CRISPR-associated protein Csx10
MLVPITIEALGPLAFPERKPGVQFRSSLPYVPGAAMYGALGRLLSETMSVDAFNALFRSIRCHNAYPILEGDTWSRPLPMTAIQPKGGKDRDTEACCPDCGDKKGAIRRPYDDSLYARVCWEQQQPAALIYMPTDAEGRPWEAVGREFYALEDAQCNPLSANADYSTAGIGKREVSQRVLTRVAINRQRGTAEDSRLYSPLVLNEVMEDRCKHLVPTRFRGSIAIPNDNTQINASLAGITHIGARQTTGVGAVEVQPQPAITPEHSITNLQHRVEAMSQRFKQQAALYTALGGNGWQPSTIFTINLISDAILYEQGWLPTNELTGDMLEEATRTFSETGEIAYPGIKARLIRAFTTTTTVGGWNVSWQRPKPTAVATQMGSLFVFQAEEGLSPADYAALALLEHNGIGERRAEGYGQVRICDEFHLLAL